ncbi:peptidoglycan-binding protein [Actinomadura viridis]|uniref:Peptidoglycan hydrolase-like protein with peptidoglycan-binding domain n=1 Tax=Actinomadura viridis TaxID=58110 RepID=A0A931DM78_9ACTN|nr:peptidoglycan-binding protein [Actinomadura viridis]MBG6091123.1 peptidoglycan hydrolase-like protein with peptidoglycan-binding domain [Actinomadura viridis]
MSRRRTVLLGAAGAVAAGGAGLATIGLGGGNGVTAAHSSLPPATAPVERTTLVETQRVDGTLGYGADRTVTGAGGSGTVTWLPGPGDEIARGRPAYKVDDRPVPLLYGSLPIYRTLAEGVEGPDVRQLEQNLRALGYTGFTVDRTFGSATTAAVKRWQEDLGVQETGTVTRGSALVAPGEIRVAERKAAVGDRAGGAILTYTGTVRQVSADLDVQYQRLARKGARVTIELPGGGTVKGTITSVGKVAKEGEDDRPTTVEIGIAVRGQGALGSYDKAPVTVHLTAARHAGVLAVPVGALLARPGGGYAVQVVEGSGVRTVPVETGVFTEGKVEVSGTGLAAGMKVGIPK